MENDTSFSGVTKYLASFKIAGWAGVIAAIVVFIIEVKLLKRELFFFGMEKKRDEAIKANHVIPAKVVSRSYRRRKNNNTLYFAHYEYTINNTTKKHVVMSRGMIPPDNISLYYVSNPNKVFSDYDVHPSPLIFIIYIIPILAAYFVMKIFGFNFDAFK